MIFFFFFKQKTAYDMRISDWSSDVCSSDLTRSTRPSTTSAPMIARIVTTSFWVMPNPPHIWGGGSRAAADGGGSRPYAAWRRAAAPARKSVVSGESGSARVDLGGLRIIQKKQNT